MLLNLDARNGCLHGQENTAPNTLALKQRDERLHAMKALVSHMVHSFNNSLAPITGYVTLLADEIPPNTTGSQYLARFSSCFAKAHGLIDAIQQATHPERNCLVKTLDLGLLLRRIAENWKAALPDGAQISVAVDVISCVLCLDESQWTRVIQHLLRNAELALTAGGMVHLTLKRQRLTLEEARVLGLESTDLYQLLVEDDGSGMPEEVLNQACDPLFTTRPHGPASGLGLTYVHSVVRLHGGQLTMASIEGTGTRVTIWMPALPVPAR